MISKSNIKEIIKSQEKFFFDIEGCYSREILNSGKLDVPIFKMKEIIIITGVRRCGKSILMRLIWDKIKAVRKLRNDQCLYINFEDERLIDYRASDLNLVLESYFEIKQPDEKEQIFLFFDEIQNIRGWEKFLNRIREDRDYKIFVTGSNATLLSKEISSQLTGRNVSIKLFPFSFREYLKAKEFIFEDREFYDISRRSKIVKLFNEFLEYGGFPEIISTQYRPLLQEYLRNIIYRDIVIRYKIKYESGLREITNFLISNIGNILSLEKISKMVRIKNLSTIKNYLRYLEESFLFYFIPMHSYSVRQQIYNPDKVYLCDIGIYNEMSFKFSENKGSILENLVFLELIKRDEQVFYGLNQKFGEIDFIVCKNNKVNKLIQCCYDISDKVTKKRETEALLAAMDYYNLKIGYIYTYDYEGEEIYESGKIFYLPVLKFVLEKSSEGKK